MSRILLLADSVVTALAACGSAAIYAIAQGAGLPGLEYASFAGLLLLVLYWTQARISLLDKQHEEREKRQDAANAELQKFIHDKMHATLQDLHAVMREHCRLTNEFRAEMAEMRRLLENKGA